MNFLGIPLSRVTFLASSLLALLCSRMPSQNVRVAFQVIALSSTPPKAGVFVTGNDSALGMWNPERVKLVRRDDSTWIGEFEIAKGKELEFKITGGAWNRQAMYEAGVIPENSRLLVENDTALVVRPLMWSDEIAPQSDAITGAVHYIRDLRGEGLAYDRDVVVWLPPSYEQDTSKRYPVLYMQDGQNIFDPRTAFAGFEWRMDETCDSLIRCGKMKSIIIVGIYNSPDRMIEYSNSDEGRAYARFVVGVVKPLIDSTYRTLADRENSAVMGSSLGGLISFLTTWWHPEVFSKAACLSPVFTYDKEATLEEVNADTSRMADVKIYMDCGGVGSEATLKPGVERMADLLKAKGFKEGIDYTLFYDANAEHNERAWASRVWRPLLFFFGPHE